MTAGGSGLAGILVDARPVDHPTAGQRGIGRYLTGLLGGLVELGAPVVALHATDVQAELLRSTLPPTAPDDTIRRLAPATLREAIAAADGRPLWYVATQLLLHPVALDPVPSLITRARLAIAAVMYDVIPYRYPERYLVHPNARTQAALRAPLARTLDAMLSISEFAGDTAADELSFPRSRIRSIGAGVDSRFAPAGSRPLPRPDRVLPAHVTRWVTSVCGIDERKNTDRLVRAWGLVPAALRQPRRGGCALVIVNAHTPEALAQWKAVARDAGVDDSVVFTGAVTDDELVALLQRSELSVMPSLEEGFGLPVVEAAACGTAVVCSSTSALREVLDDPAAHLDPTDTASIARAIERALTDQQHHVALVAAAARAADRWTWRRTADDLVAALTELGPRWPGRARPPSHLVAQVEDDRVQVLGRDYALAEGPDGSVTWPVGALGPWIKPWDVDQTVPLG